MTLATIADLGRGLANRVTCWVHRLGIRRNFGLEPHQVQRIGCVLIAIAFVEGMRRLYNFRQLDQMYEIKCQINDVVDGKKLDFTYYKNEAETRDAVACHCLAKMYKTGNGVEKSLPKARYWFQQASNQGLYLATQELCKPFLFSDWTRQEKTQASKGGFWQNLCCPGLSICPWGPVQESLGDYSRYSGKRFFGWHE